MQHGSRIVAKFLAGLNPGYMETNTNTGYDFCPENLLLHGHGVSAFYPWWRCHPGWALEYNPLSDDFETVLLWCISSNINTFAVKSYGWQDRCIDRCIQWRIDLSSHEHSAWHARLWWTSGQLLFWSLKSILLMDLFWFDNGYSKRFVTDVELECIYVSFKEKPSTISLIGIWWVCAIFIWIAII